MNSKKSKKQFLLDKLLILLAIICITFAALIIGLYLSNTEIFANNANGMKTNYSSTESNSWDISENQDGSVMATLDDNGVLTISGTGKLETYYSETDRPFNSITGEIKSIKIENGISNIGDFMFASSPNLINVEIPSSVTTIGINPFADCQNLININVDSNNAKYKDENGVLYSKDGTKIIVYPAGKQKTEYTILNGTTTICAGALSYCEKLTTIKIPNSVNDIEMGAFFECTNLTNIEIPSGVTSVEDSVFSCCESLKSITIPNGVTSIGIEAFSDCYSLENITIPNSVTSIGDYAFEWCDNLVNINIPNSVTSIGYGAFGCCFSLKNLELPSSVTSIGEAAFYGCVITNLVNPQNNAIELPNLLKRAQNQTDLLYSSQEFTLTNCTIQGQQIIINEDATYGIVEVKDGKLKDLWYVISYNTWDISETGDGSLTATLDENGLMKISGNGNMKNFPSNEESPWYCTNTLIKNIKIEEGPTNLKLFEFNYFFNLKTIEIPSTAVSLGEDEHYILYSCYELTDIFVNSNNTKYSDENGVLYSKDKKELIRYPVRKKVEEYKILEGVETISEVAFSDTNYLENLEIPSSLKNMGDYAFKNCYNLKNVTILEGATTIGNNAFEYCDNLEKIIIPTTVTEIGEEAFHSWDGVDSMKILCRQNSYAETYAKENNIPYQIIYLNSIEQEIDEINLMIKNIQPKTTMQDFKNDLSSEISYVVLDLKGNEITDASKIIGTGYKIKLEDNTIYTIIITGDANGDGQSDIKDILAINKHRLNKADLMPEYFQAGDVKEDGTADIKDILQINKFRLGKINEL